jgi:predicted ATPase with chaperone activity
LSTAGFPDSTVHENRDWVRAAIRNAGLEFPGARITVTLACRPAEGEDLASCGLKHFMSKHLKGEKKS